MTASYHPPVKRSVEIAGHKTSITLEPVFWDMLREHARALGVPINAVVARIDAARLEADEPTGLASAIRQYLVEGLRSGDGASPTPPDL
ncbi:ribbon-helix-helix domain-containing protein [Alteriqipengyuania sp. 357]